MARTRSFDAAVFFRVIAGTALGAAGGAALLLGVVPGAGDDYRPAVLSTILVPLGCFLGWLLSGSRERAGTAAAACFGLYFLSAFAAARLGTIFPALRYFPTTLGVQSAAALGLATALGLLGRGVPQVEKLYDARDTAGLAALLREGPPPERAAAARALGALGTPDSRPPLLAALEDPDPQVRREALAGLVGLAQEEDRPRIAGWLQHDEARTRRLAREVLRWIEK